jgi:phosphoglycerate dehydrogenase-like enzyme
VTRVLNLCGRQFAEGINTTFPEVEVVRIPRDEPIPDDLTGDVLVAGPGAAPAVAILAPRVDWFHVMGTGIDWIPVEAFQAKTVTCARGGSALAISEFVLAAMLSYEKQLPELWARSGEDVWFRPSLGTLHGRRLGLVGFGGIGQAVATRALAFGMSVAAVRRHPGPSPMPGVEAEGLEAVIGGADHLVLTTPDTPETHHLIRAETLEQVKPGVHLVNIARGGLVDQDALRVALDDGRVARATLDVSDPEPLPPGHWMYSHPSVRLTGHISWSSPAGMEPLVQALLDNLSRYLRGETLLGLVDPAVGY